MNNPFLTLGLHPSATKEEVEAAYQRLYKLYHPAYQVTSFSKDLSNKQWKEIEAAYRFIMKVNASSPVFQKKREERPTSVFPERREERPASIFPERGEDKPASVYPEGREDKPASIVPERGEERPASVFPERGEERPASIFPEGREDRPASIFPEGREDRPASVFPERREETPTSVFPEIGEERPTSVFPERGEERPASVFPEIGEERPASIFPEGREERPTSVFPERGEERPASVFPERGEERPASVFPEGREASALIKSLPCDSSSVHSLIGMDHWEDAELLLDRFPIRSRDEEWHFLKGVLLYRRGEADMAYKQIYSAYNTASENHLYSEVLQRIAKNENIDKLVKKQYQPFKKAAKPTVVQVQKQEPVIPKQEPVIPKTEKPSRLMNPFGPIAPLTSSTHVKKPTVPPSYTAVHTLISQKRWQEAEMMIDSFPVGNRDAEWHYLKGTILYAKGWLEEGYKQMKTAYNMAPENQVYSSEYNRISLLRNTDSTDEEISTEPTSNCNCKICNGLSDCCDSLVSPCDLIGDLMEAMHCF